MTAHPFRAWRYCEAAGCLDSPTTLVVVRDVADEWPELVDADGAVRFVVCDAHAAALPATARGSDGRARAVERFPT